MHDKEMPRMAPQTRLNNLFLSFSHDCITLGAPIRVKSGKVPGTFSSIGA
jgi:hypothetical protein